MRATLLVLILATGPWLTLLSSSFLRAEDWPMFGRDRTHNAVSPEKNAPTDWRNERRHYQTGKVTQEAHHIKWMTKLGRSVSNPVVANGLVWIGSNNYYPREADKKGDASVLMCFRERDGQFLYQYFSPRLPEGSPQDSTNHAMGSVPLIEGDRLWLLTNRSEVVCLDIGPLRRGDGVPREQWKVDLRKEFGVFPHAPMMAAGFSPSVVAHQDWIYIVTGNGVDESHVNLPAPNAPSVVCLHKHTGKTVWKDASPGKDLMHCQRSSPLVVEHAGKAQVLVGQGDGWLRSFDAATGKLLWKFDLNPKHYSKYELGGNSPRSYVMATPVLHENRVYLATGQDPEYYEGVGHLWCIDLPKASAAGGDVSPELLIDAESKPPKTKPNPSSAAVWHYGGAYSKADAEKFGRDYPFGRTQSNMVIRDGLVYAAELAGYLHCLDAATGAHYWTHDLKAAVWSSPLWVDDKVYVATEDGEVWIFIHGKGYFPPRRIDMGEPIRASPIFANGVLYLATESKLYVIPGKK